MDPTATTSRPLACVVMAGGRGTRMRSAVPKVLHALCGRPILGWVLAAARDASAERVVVVTPPEAEEVRALLGDDAVARRPARGARHRPRGAVRPGGAGGLRRRRARGLRRHAADHRRAAARGRGRRTAARARVATLLTVDVPSRTPTAASSAATAATSTASSRRATPRPTSWRSPRSTPASTPSTRGRCARRSARLRPDNDQGELYLPDVLPSCARPAGASSRTVTEPARLHDRASTRRVDLAEPSGCCAARLLERPHARRRRHRRPRRRPSSRPASCSSPSASSSRSRSCCAATHVGRRGAQVGPHAVLQRRARRRGGHGGPVLLPAPGAVLLAGAKAGTSSRSRTLDRRAREGAAPVATSATPTSAPDTNIGAGSDHGQLRRPRKHRTTIGARVRTGSHNVFVAPVTIGDERVYRRRVASSPRTCPTARSASRGRDRSTSTEYAQATPTARWLTHSCSARPSSAHGDPRRTCGSTHGTRAGADALLRPLEPRPGRAHRAAARRRRSARHAEDVPNGEIVRALRRVRARRRRVPRAVVRAARRPDHERQADGAADHGRRGASSARPSASPPSCPWYPVLAPGQEVGAARADHGAPGGDAAADRRRRARADDGSARRSGAGLLRRPGRPHDRAADVRAVLPRPRHARRRRRRGLAPTPAAPSWRRSSPRCSTRRSRSSRRSARATTSARGHGRHRRRRAASRRSSPTT